MTRFAPLRRQTARERIVDFAESRARPLTAPLLLLTALAARTSIVGYDIAARELRQADRDGAAGSMRAAATEDGGC